MKTRLLNISECSFSECKDISSSSKDVLARSRLYLNRVNVRSDNVPRGLVNNFALNCPLLRSSQKQTICIHCQKYSVPLILKLLQLNKESKFNTETSSLNVAGSKCSQRFLEGYCRYEQQSLTNMIKGMVLCLVSYLSSISPEIKRAGVSLDKVV